MFSDEAKCLRRRRPLQRRRIPLSNGFRSPPRMRRSRSMCPKRSCRSGEFGVLTLRRHTGLRRPRGRRPRLQPRCGMRRLRGPTPRVRARKLRLRRRAQHVRPRKLHLRRRAPHTRPRKPPLSRFPLPLSRRPLHRKPLEPDDTRHHTNRGRKPRSRILLPRLVCRRKAELPNMRLGATEPLTGLWRVLSTPCAQRSCWRPRVS